MDNEEERVCRGDLEGELWRCVGWISTAVRVVVSEGSQDEQSGRERT